MEVREQDYIQHSNRVAILENPNDSEDTNSDWKDIGENMKISANEGLGQYEREKVWWRTVRIFRSKEGG